MKKLIFIALMLFAKFTFSQSSPQSPTSFVLDSVNTLTSSQITNLNDAITATYQKTQVKLIVVLLDSLPKGYSIKDFSLYVGSRYQTRNYDADILVYVASVPHHIHHLQALSGAGTAVFDPKKCGTLLYAMKPDFKAKDYYDGLQLLVKNVNFVLDSTQNPQQVMASGGGPTGQTNYTWFIVGALVIIAVVAFFFLFRSSKNKKL